ncbi:MAG: UDP-N-acetylmuramoyl-tripeptide--D-alanyl-D-alanine ligase [Candidatus Omnitrophica bacterium]|nr:UDP-N-acetylmuramoyl-tripeptide--D-alanyl-D-alanine ligase [Candidatus Omnitrophota bacterium]
MLNLADIRRVCRGRIMSGEARGTVDSVSIDSRTVQPGGLFVAIKGDRFDGHRYIAQAAAKGARAVIVSRRVAAKGMTVIQVSDTVRALGRIACLHRQHFSGPVIAITGSAGKTSCRRVIAAVLGASHRVLQSARSENNWIGVPLTLLKLRPEHDIAVVEAGTNQTGDMAWLASIIQPDVTVFTNIGDSHLAGLKDRGGVYREKIHLAQGRPGPAAVLFNADDEYLARIPQEGWATALKGFSVDSPSDCRARDVRVTAAGGVRFRVGGSDYHMRLPGRQHVYNALAAILCARRFRVPPVNVRTALARITPADNRGNLVKTRGGVWILDDTYNANPLSFQRALEFLAELPGARRRIVVCGDMLELGAMSRRLHQDLGRCMAQAGVAVLLGFGAQSRYVVDAYRQAAPAGIATGYGSLSALHRGLGRIVRRGDVVLVKGSRSMRMEKTVEYLKGKLS